MIDDPRRFLEHLFHTAVAAADPARVIGNHLPEKPKGRTVVIGAGKASAVMGAAFEEAWEARGNGPVEGLIVTRYGHGAPCRGIEIVEAAHPVPDDSGERAARRILALVSELSADDLVVALISGGGSALLTLPPLSIGAEAKRLVNKALLASGASIHEMNCVRKHLSQIKGGRLAKAAAPARVVTLVLSDIPGDDPALVASGPTIADATTRDDALAIIERYAMELPEAVIRWLKDPASEAPRPDDPAFRNHSHHTIANASISLEAAAEAARDQGLEAYILSDAVEGEAREAGRFHAALAREVADKNRPFSKPCVILSGGETTVTLRAKGRGGRNSEFLLGLALGIEGVTGISALAADTDGIDGSEDNAGAWCDGTTVDRLARRGLKARDLLAGNDAYSAFEALGDLVVTGPTRTNVNDFRAILIR